MVPPEKKSATAAVGAKSVRACDNCIRTRARWYCAADDAFLCPSCDSSVHSANSLARRHERVRLKTASLKQISVPTWHRGFTRRTRTPRQKKLVNKLNSDEQKQQKSDRGQLFNPHHLVPDFGSEDNSQEEENEEQLLYRVPIFDPFVVELCTSAHSYEAPLESRPVPNEFSSHDMKRLEGFLPSDMDLAEFAADVESLLGKGLEDESFNMEGLGILDYDHHHEEEKALKGNERVKVEEEEGVNTAIPADHEKDAEFVDLGRDTFELNFDYDDSAIGDEGEENKMEMPLVCNLDDSKEANDSGKMFLRLDYERVASAWDNKRCPWTNGERPDLAYEECWRPDCMGECGTVHFYGDIGVMSGRSTGMTDGGREARVSRYREKRRTRLFSKKIRYEVRKLNAEKRPRMKGRFVKRSNFVAPPFSLSNKI